MQNKKSLKRDNSKKENFKKHSGITLIALIITIIVLLILAGVALATLTGDSGILSNADKAKENTNKANVKEQVQLAVQTALIESLGKEISEENLQEELDKIFGEGVASLSYDETDKMYTVTVKEYEVIVSNKGSVESVQKAGETNENISIKLTLSHSNTTLNAEELPNVSEVTSENVPIPEGFYRVGGTKDTGVVISDVSGDDLNNTKQGNQFVWVPVNQNQKLTLEVTSNEEITGITIVAPDGTQTEVTPNEKTSHSQEIEMIYNGLYMAKVETANETKIVKKEVRSLYAQLGIIEKIIDSIIQDAPEKYKTADEFKNANDGRTIDELAEESNLSIGMFMAQNGILIEELELEFKIAFIPLFVEMDGSVAALVDNNQNKPSVDKYGGFYIARYEAGDGETETARDYNNSSDENLLVSQKGAFVYNYIDWETAKNLSSGMYGSNDDHVTSQLITGAGWDRTLNWLIETGMDEEKVLYDSRSWGNYSNSTGNALTNSGSSNMNYKTGRSEYWKANNIYDLAGNTWEWTQETSGTNSIHRGGSCYSNGDDHPSSIRNHGHPANEDYAFSFRAQLYIK